MWYNVFSQGGELKSNSDGDQTDPGGTLEKKLKIM